MLSITIPLWIMLVAAGVPTLLLSLLIFRLLRLKRKKKERSTPTYQPVQRQRPFEDFSGRIHQELLDQQIDAVFNALVTILETERLKLKALVNHSLPIGAMGGMQTPARPQVAPNRQNYETQAQPPSAPEPTLGQRIIAMSNDGAPPEEIAGRLNLSQTEVSLALKMNSGHKGELGGKVRAVA